MSKYMVETDETRMTSQYGVLRTYARAHAHAPGYPHARMNTDQYVILIALPLQQWFRERASVLYVIRILPVFFVSLNALCKYDSVTISVNRKTNRSLSQYLFYEISSSESLCNTWGQTEGQAWRI